ncbi:hypothetical protein INT43_001418 [Umbelopsis isabellina]|uniref:GP-PDE domain-containing protein n=1 Tax=Mortierella isabellina TaxID=91625 RepID=A0A8H7PDJ6_MORIS|nr:hypothetical protein INT43_001418 [Umbelopsis isabellina]
MLSLQQAVKAGANGIESDIHMTKDGEMVMLHDPRLDRTTDGKGIIKEQNWYGNIENLRTKKEPHCPIPRMGDVLAFLKEDENVKNNVYLVVDIKNDNSPTILEELHKLIAVHAPHDFSKQIVIGIWHPRFLPLAKKLFEGYTLCFIGSSVPAARTHFFNEVDALSINFVALATPDGQQLIHDAHKANKKVYTWTVNTPDRIQEAARWGVDVILGDDIETLLQNSKHGHPAVDNKALTIANKPYMTFSRRWYYYFLSKILQFFTWKVLGI